MGLKAISTVCSGLSPKPSRVSSSGSKLFDLVASNEVFSFNLEGDINGLNYSIFPSRSLPKLLSQPSWICRQPSMNVGGFHGWRCVGDQHARCHHILSKSRGLHRSHPSPPLSCRINLQGAPVAFICTRPRDQQVTTSFILNILHTTPPILRRTFKNDFLHERVSVLGINLFDRHLVFFVIVNITFPKDVATFYNSSREIWQDQTQIVD